MASPSRFRISLIPAVALAVAVAVIGGLSFQRKVETFQPLGFEAVVRNGSWEVTSVDATESVLQTGDQILAINGQGIGLLADPTEVLRRKPTNELAVLRAGRVESLTHALPPLAIDYPYVILALIGAGYLLIGFYTLLRDPRRPSVVFYVWCLTSALLYLTSPTAPFDGLGKTIYLLDELARIFVGPLTLHLFLIFPRPLSTGGRVTRIVPFLYLPAAFLLLLQTDLIAANGAWLLGGQVAQALPALDRFELYHLVLYSFAALAVLLWRLRRTLQPEPFRQATWIAVGLAGGYLPFLILYVLPLSLGLDWPRPITTLAVLPLALVPLTFAWAILRYKLWDIGVLVRDTMTMSLTLLVGVCGFSLANLVIHRAVPEQLDLARNLVTFVSGILIAGLLVPTRKGIGVSLERLQYRGGFGRRRALAEFGRELLEERSLARLCSSLIDRLRSALELQRTSLLLANEDRLLPALPQRSLTVPLDLDVFDPDFWASEVEVLSAVEFPARERTAKQRLFADGFRYAFPIRVRDNRIGVLLVGYKDEQTPLSSDDLDLVRNLLNQAALAIDNARLLDQVGRQLDEVVRLKRYNEGIIESSPAGIAVLDHEGQVVSANRAFSRLVGLHEGEVPAGRDVCDLLPLDQLPAPDGEIRELSLIADDGGERYLQVSVAPFQEDDAEAQQVVIVQDVSDRVAMESQLKEKERLAALGMLAAGVAHEVNTPITGISSYAQMLLEETPDGDPRRELLQKVEKQTFRAARIVNNLLEFARDRPRERTPTAVAPLVTDCLELLEHRLAERRVEIDWQPPGEVLEVLGNDGELQQVFTNLIINATDAMDADGKDGRPARLRLTLEANDGWVVAAVEDNGPGLSQEQLGRIFQPFYSTKLAKGGTGLGLAISFNIVRRHGGQIRVVSHPGEGARFIVELPRHRRTTA